MTAANEAALQGIRTRLRDRYRVATCLGFGPRFLHSTGQAYKGGPGTGVFLQITCRRRPGPARARPALHLRRREGGAGPGRPRGPRGARPARAARAPRRGRPGGASDPRRGPSSRRSADGTVASRRIVRAGATRRERTTRADRHDRARPHGRQHGAPAHAGRPRGRRATRRIPRRSEQLAGEGALGATSLDELVERLAPPRAVWVMVPAGAPTEQVVADLGERMEAGRHDHRRRQLVLQGRRPPRGGAPEPGHPLRRRGHERRHLGARARLLPDDRRRAGRGRAPRPDLPRRSPPAAATIAAHARPEAIAGHRRAGVPPLRAGRGRALREDDPQRDRVRPHAGLRRGLRHPAERAVGGPAGGAPLRSPPRATSPRSGGAGASSAPGSST